MKTIKHKFVEFIPEDLEENTIYITIEYSTAVHKCVCGCGKKVVTPLSPTDWKLIFDGETISLYPSIGNWNFECRSHYWISKNNIQWAEKWSKKKINAGRKRDSQTKDWYFENQGNSGDKQTDKKENSSESKKGFWKKLRKK